MTIEIEPQKGLPLAGTTQTRMQTRPQELGKLRSEDFALKVSKTMSDIDVELAQNSGVYPRNKGALSLTELARRAEVHITSFYTSAQEDFFIKVRKWLTDCKEVHQIGRGRAKRAKVERMADWSEKYNGLAQSHRDTELELQDVMAKLDAAHIETQRLLDENMSLRSMMQAGRAANDPF